MAFAPTAHTRMVPYKRVSVGSDNCAALMRLLVVLRSHNRRTAHGHLPGPSPLPHTPAPTDGPVIVALSRLFLFGSREALPAHRGARGILYLHSQAICPYRPYDTSAGQGDKG